MSGALLVARIPITWLEPHLRQGLVPAMAVYEVVSFLGLLVVAEGRKVATLVHSVFTML